MIYHIHSTDLWKAKRTDDNSSVVTEAEILLSLSCVAKEGSNIQADPEAYGDVKIVRQSILLILRFNITVQHIYDRLNAI